MAITTVTIPWRCMRYCFHHCHVWFWPQNVIKLHRCNKELKICEGISMNGPCRISADCNVGLFCNFWHCTTLLQQGERCTSHDQCGRDALCYFINAGDVSGICTNLFTYDDEYQLLPLGLDNAPSNIFISLFLWC